MTETSAASSIIRCVDLWRTYQMGEETIHALRGVSFEIQPNEYLAIMGPSGSGKSTLMNLIGCLDTPSQGEYYLRNQLVSKMSDDALAEVRNKEIGFVFQTFNLLPRASALENVELPLVYAGIPKAARMERARDALDKVELSSRMSHKPNELSGGQRQRVAIARALVMGPAILLADEPTGNLDPTTSAGIMALLERINAGGTTVIMATHEAGIVDQMQRRVIELASGKIVRDERQGGYATAAIPTITEGAGTHRRASIRSAQPPAAGPVAPRQTTPTPGTRAPAAAPRFASVFAPAPAEPLTFPSAPVPVASLAERHEPAPARAEREQAAAIAADTGMPLPHVEPEPEPAPPTDPGRPMARPALPVTQHDVPEQLTLAEKLGLRAPGEKTDQSGEQNVGPTR